MSAEQGCKILWVVMVLIILPTSLLAQKNKEDLTAERNRIEQQLATTSRLIKDAKKNRQAASSQVALIDKQIELREELIRHHQSSIRSLERSVRGTDSEIRSLEGHIEALKDEYAEMIRQAYRLQLSSNPLMFVFASEDFNQASHRFKMLQSYAEERKRQAIEITKAQTELTHSRTELTIERASVEAALEDQQKEMVALSKDRESRAELLSELKQKESQLRKKQKAQEKERTRLNEEIKRIIEAELAAERASSKGEFALTPEGRIVSEAFEKNKNTLPWPVHRGVVTADFGRHAHPTIPGIVIESNGIDITTDSNASVLTIFKGKVSSVFSLPGAGKTVIITHGVYRTVYSNLNDVSVVKGDDVERGAEIGHVLTQSGGTTVHFEIWKVAGSTRSPQNPKSWLQPR
jgi:septal ring factor EnvC (AmiA/AmiB activator)